MKKIKELIEKHFGIIVISGIILVVMLITLLDIKNEVANEPSSYTKTSDEVALPNPSQYVKIEKSTPEGPYIETWDVYTPVVLYFSEPVYERSIKVKVVPNIEMVPIKIKEEDNYVQLFPKDGWYPGVNYKITITEASSLSGKSLYKTYTTNIRVIKTEGPAVY